MACGPGRARGGLSRPRSGEQDDAGRRSGEGDLGCLLHVGLLFRDERARPRLRRSRRTRPCSVRAVMIRRMAGVRSFIGGEREPM
ncbi:hypothetical protein HMPREF0682_1696 [Propionibacterium acidifaciens F0233]|uniref:Uncharacterized protein n=1 Tax=Propionibacterium acidifaciens F0233 TaxID=553198 RepID=U2QEW3_9ACTN|nr:hypothetical protein HMPREF0682_1696 [Propionibacterium acidifaciens F0233]